MRWSLLVVLLAFASIAGSCGRRTIIVVQTSVPSTGDLKQTGSNEASAALQSLLPTLNLDQGDVRATGVDFTPIAPLAIDSENLTLQEFAIRYPGLFAQDGSAESTLMEKFHAQAVSASADSGTSGQQYVSALILFATAEDAAGFVSASDQAAHGMTSEDIDLPRGVSTSVSVQGAQLRAVGRISSVFKSSRTIDIRPMLGRLADAQGIRGDVDPYFITAKTFAKDYGNGGDANLKIQFGKATFELLGGASQSGYCVGFGDNGNDDGAELSFDQEQDGSAGLRLALPSGGVTLTLHLAELVVVYSDATRTSGTFTGATANNRHVTGAFHCA